MRIDTTAIEANIHYPLDSRQLWDYIHVITRIVRELRASHPELDFSFHDHPPLGQEAPIQNQQTGRHGRVHARPRKTRETTRQSASQSRNQRGASPAWTTARKAGKWACATLLSHRSKATKFSDLIKSERVCKKLRKWRAGIEGIISTAKRTYGLVRSNWSGFKSFKVYVHLGVIAFNLTILARHLFN
ncbi:transposase [Candidatus Hydrogenedentota bacterium]